MEAADDEVSPSPAVTSTKPVAQVAAKKEVPKVQKVLKLD